MQQFSFFFCLKPGIVKLLQQKHVYFSHISIALHIFQGGNPVVDPQILCFFG